MFNMFTEHFEVFDCTFDIEVNGDMQRSSMQAPRMIIEKQFIQFVQQASQTNSPVKIKMSRMVPVYDDMRDEWIERENSIVFTNNAYKDYEE